MARKKKEEPKVEIEDEFIVETPLGEIVLPQHEANYLNYRGYRGDTTIKRTGVQMEWTPELLAEYKRCADSHEYFIETYMKIVNIDEGLIGFKLRGYQRQLLKNINDNRRCITTMARQSGKSTSVIGYVLWYILFNEYRTVMLLANKAPTAREILGKAQLAYTLLPKFLQQGVIEWNKGSIVLENGSRAIAEATSADSIRGYSVNLLILDEAAHIEGWEEFSKSTLPVISSGRTSKIVLISTPHGLNHFYSYWERAQYWQTPPEKLPPGVRWNGYVPLLVTWREVPGRDEQWYTETVQELNFDMDKFNQEYLCQFLGSSGTLIAGWKLKELVARVPLYQNNGLSKYKDVEKTHKYAITVDMSEGKGLDYSTFNVIDITKMPFEQVAVFRSNLTTPGDVTEILFLTATAYNKALVLVEYENMGLVVANDILLNYEYEYLLYTKMAGRDGKHLCYREDGADRGLKMSVAVKGHGCSLLKLLIEQNQLLIHDHNTIEELARFARKNKTWGAEEGWHDDLVMSLVVFAWMSNQSLFKHHTEIATLQELRDQPSELIEKDLQPFGFIQSTPATVMETWKAPTDFWVEQPMANPNMPIIGYNPYKLLPPSNEDDDGNIITNF